MEEQAFIKKQCEEKIQIGNELIVELKFYENVNGIQRIQKKIFAEVSNLKHVKTRMLNKMFIV